MPDVQVVPVAEYAAIRSQTRDNNLLHHVHVAASYALDGRIKDVELTILRVADGLNRMYGVVHAMPNEKVVFILSTDTYESEFVEFATFALLRKIQPILDGFQCFINAYARDDVHVHVDAYFSSHSSSHPFAPMDEPNYNYIPTRAQAQQLAERRPIPIHPDYEFCRLRPEDAVQLCSEHLLSGQSDANYVANRLKHFVGVGARHRATGELVAYEYWDGCGSITTMYTRKDHRHKGLASAVEAKLCQLGLDELGHRPHKGVSPNRPRVIAMTMANPLWTPIFGPDGKPQLYYYTIRSKTEKPKIVVFED